MKGVGKKLFVLILLKWAEIQDIFVKMERSYINIIIFHYFFWLIKLSYKKEFVTFFNSNILEYMKKSNTN